jgi:hypothetical protein
LMVIPPTKKSIVALELAQTNGAIVLQQNGQATHRLQPLDVGVFGSMQVFYYQVQDLSSRSMRNSA